MLENLLTTTEAAARMGTSDSLVRRYIRLGKLPATEAGAMYFIKLADLKRFDAERPKRRRQGKEKRGAK